MDLLADRGRRVSLEELNTSRLLAHARKQAVQRNLDDLLIVDVDGHHYENECYDDFLPLIENEVLRQLILSGRAKGRQTLMPSQVSFQDMGAGASRAIRCARRKKPAPAPIVTCSSVIAGWMR